MYGDLRIPDTGDDPVNLVRTTPGASSLEARGETASRHVSRTTLRTVRNTPLVFQFTREGVPLICIYAEYNQWILSTNKGKAQE